MTDGRKARIMASATQRVLYDIGLEQTTAWLCAALEPAQDLDVLPLSIPYIDPSMMNKADKQRFDRLRSGNQSVWHSYLKLAGWNWLETSSNHPATIATEVTCYEPPIKTEDGRRCYDGLGLEIDIYSPHIIYSDWNSFPVSYGKRVIVDLHAFDYAMEVGATQAINLMLPLTAGLADCSIWIPYPPQTKANGLHQLPHKSEPLQAYEIRLRKRPQTRRYRTPNKNARGPHPYPINQWALVDWCIEKYGQRAPQYAERQAKKMVLAFKPAAAKNWMTILNHISHALAEADEE